MTSFPHQFGISDVRTLVGHPGLRRRNLAALGAVWSTARGEADLERQRAEVIEYFELGVRLPVAATVIDVGAHCGLFACEVGLRSVGATLALVEPIPLFQEAITRNLRERCLAERLSPRSRLYPVGVANTTSSQPIEFATFTRLPTDTTCHIDEKYAEFAQVFRHHAERLRGGLSGALPGALGRGLGDLTYAVLADVPVAGWKKRLFDSAVGLRRVACRVVRLEEILALHPGPIDLVKIDCEGAEREALESIERSQWSRIEGVVLEGNGGASQRRAIAELLSAQDLTDQSFALPAAAGDQGLQSYLLYARRPRP